LITVIQKKRSKYFENTFFIGLLWSEFLGLGKEHAKRLHARE
jgi:hypothetical protein